MYSGNYNTVGNTFNNPNLQGGTIGLSIESGNNGSTTFFRTNTPPQNTNEVLNSNINNNSCNVSDTLGLNNLNNTTCNCNENVCVYNNNDTCGYNYSGNNSCSCNNNNSCGCNCNGCNCNNNNSCSCNCNGNNNNNNANITNNNNDNDNDNVTNNSLQRNLRNFIGRRVTLEFNNCGSCSKKTGVLTCVGRNFVTLRSVNNNTCLLADTAGLTFVTVHNCCS